MEKTRMTCVKAIFVIALAATLQGCVLALAGAAGGGALVATDRRTLGTQTEDRGIQLKALTQLSNSLPDTTHINVAVFNRYVLLTGEVPDEQVKQQAKAIVQGIENVSQVINALAIAPASTFSSRANDAYLEGRVKTALIATKDISANHFKVVCERGTIYLMGLVTKNEGDIGADIASQVPDVTQVIKVFQYISPPSASAEAAVSTNADAPSTADSNTATQPDFKTNP